MIYTVSGCLVVAYCVVCFCVAKHKSGLNIVDFCKEYL